jgi:hypothetical protein
MLCVSVGQLFVHLHPPTIINNPSVMETLQDYVIMLLLHQMVVSFDRTEYSVNYCVCVLLRMGLWEITLTEEMYNVFG